MLQGMNMFIPAMILILKIVLEQTVLKFLILHLLYLLMSSVIRNESDENGEEPNSYGLQQTPIYNFRHDAEDEVVG